MSVSPIPLVWNLQMNYRINLPVTELLSLGIWYASRLHDMNFADRRTSASITGVVRFATIVKDIPAVAIGVDYLYILDPIMTWARKSLNSFMASSHCPQISDTDYLTCMKAEPVIATIAANLPALKPLL